MKDIYDLLGTLKKIGARIYIENGKIKLDIQPEKLTKEIADAIKTFREELIDFLSETRSANFDRIEKTEEQESYPMSDAQRRLWIIDRMYENSSAYNMPGNFYLNSTVDIESFKKALKSVIERHEILRTVFKADESGEVRQWILPKDDPKFKIQYVDFRNVPDKQIRIKQHLMEDANGPFDLENGPLLRSGLIQIEDEDFIYHSNMHHIISDGWSMNIYFRDLYAYYNAYEKKRMPDLEELRIQYKDYTVWQLGQLEKGVYNADREYWFNHLNGDLPQLNLPSNKPRKKVKTYTGDDLKDSIISPMASQKLKSFTETNSGSLFMGLFAIWNILMYRYTGQKDIIIGTPISGREHVDMKDQIGFYINTLAIRNKIQEGDTFRSFFTRVKQTMIDSFSHQMYPFNRLVEELDFDRDISRSPIFDIMLVYGEGTNKKEDVEESKQKLGGIADYGYSSSKFDLEVGFTNIDNDYISIWCNFNPDVYEREMAERVIKHFSRLVKVLLEEPDTKISTVDFLSKADKNKQVLSFNNTAAAYSKESSLIDLFEIWVEKTPDAIALTHENRELSYRELHELSNQLAQCLSTEHDIQRNDFVGIQLDRSEWVIVTILGILKAGGTYVPIDPDYPESRKEHIIRDTNIKLLITEANYVFDIDYFDGAIFAIDVEFEPDNYSAESLKNDISPDQLAYVIYTSGSTGVPKGVMVEHKAVVRLVSNPNFITVSEGDKILGLSNFSFDGSTFDIFMPLLNGGQFVIAPKGVLVDTEKLRGIISSQEIDSFFITTALFNSLVDTGGEELGKVKYILFGGEQVSVGHVYRFKENYPQVKLHHVYGPTENTTFSTWYPIENVDKNAHTIPIGSGISNSTVYILDDQNQILPLGVTGEICVAGAGLAKGYLNNEELTNTRFVPHPFKDGEKMYKTGDLGKWSDEGQIEFIGRKDDQVKVRGYRIELGEIEHALASLTEIEGAVVLAKQAKTGEKELVAYFTAATEQNIITLKTALRSSLPEYMLPAYFVQLDKMPLTSNGKVDKKLLPNPEGMGITTGVEYIEPRTETEQKILAIWQEILLREKISVKDDFFDLGGHSLKAVRLSNEYQKTFDVKLSVDDLFTETTLELHAELILNGVKSEFVEIPSVDNNDYPDGYPISDAQRRLWVLSQFAQSSVAYNMPSFLRLNQNIDIPFFTKAIHATIERHEILRTVFKSDSHGDVKQIVLTPEELKFEIEQKDFVSDGERSVKLAEEYIDNDSFMPFDLENGPLLRAALLKVRENEYYFYFNMHHIISDGWSLEILAKDIFAFYDAYNENRSPDLNPLRIQYKDYSVWQLAQLDNPEFIEQNDFWKKQLSGELPVLDFSSNRNRPVVKTNNGRALSTYINKDLTDRLKQFTHDEKGSLFISLLAVWNVLTYRYTGQKDIILGTPVAGRPHADLKDQIGFYLNTLALRNNVDPTLGFRTFYNEVKNGTLKAFNHQTYPFDRLVENLDLTRDTSRSAVFDVMLILQNVSENTDTGNSESESGRVDVDRIVDEGELASKFDMSITFQESGQLLSFQVKYNPDVYEKEMVEGLIHHFKILLETILDNPEEEIANLDYLSEDEQRELLQYDNQCDLSDFGSNSIPDLFKQQVKKTPSEIALTFKEHELSYQELDRYSDQLANYLVEEKKAKPNDLIGIQLERSEKLIVALLAVLKTGGAYVPIDPEFPESRIDHIRKDANCKVCIDEELFEVFEQNRENYSGLISRAHVDSESLAYVIYTSGSTGKPKGVMVSSKSIVDYTYGVLDKTNMRDCKHFGHVSTFAADLGNTVIFPALLTGGNLHILPREAILDAEKMKIAALDCVKMTPSHWNALQETNTIHLPVKTLILGGEQLSQEIIKKIKNANTSCLLFNHYGPTETTIGKLIHKVDDAENLPAGTLGKPIGNNQVFILDESLQLCANGIEGEICISGIGVAKGYLNDEELKASGFVDNPLIKGERLYRTGDLGKRLPGGEIVFIGRKDNQVKIRGYRIEPGEIEKAMSQIPNINFAFVSVIEGNKEAQLVAYFCSDSEENVNKLRAALKEKLPAYMIPAYFVQIQEMPLTPNGKIDSKSLPDPKVMELQNGTEYVEAQNETEKIMVDIWEDVLQRDKIGVKDDFFALGGHSISAIKVMSKIQELFGVRLNLEEFFNDPTIKNLSEYIDALNLIEKQSSITLDQQDELFF